MKKLKLLSIYLFLFLLVWSFSSCSKTKSFIGTYDGVTNTSGTAYFSIPGYGETNEDIPADQQNVTFEISKGEDNNKIVLKQTSGDVNQQFEAIGVVNDKTATFLPFTIPLSYANINVDAQVTDMVATVEDGTLTYSYSYSYYQSLMGATISIRINANGTAEKK